FPEWEPSVWSQREARLLPLKAFCVYTDTPGPPVNFRFEEVRKNSVICKWDPPLDDGGSEILNYTLEKKDNSKLEIGWSCVTSTLRRCHYLVPKLIEKKEYIFRVMAENKYGAGPCCVSKPLVAKNPFGMVSFLELTLLESNGNCTAFSCSCGTLRPTKLTCSGSELRIAMADLTHAQQRKSKSRIHSAFPAHQKNHALQSTPRPP
uniref:Fibronectin type-III domain-containing protein n=1 Tax=Mola mola TaxID=94237 RepID=A0A3Q3XM20_MOLML